MSISNDEKLNLDSSSPSDESERKREEIERKLSHAQMNAEVALCRPARVRNFCKKWFGESSCLTHLAERWWQHRYRIYQSAMNDYQRFSR